MSAPALSPLVSFRFRNILYATDFSPCSEKALSFVRGIATHFGSTVHAIHVLAPRAQLAAVVDPAPELDTELQEAERQMGSLTLRPEMKGLTRQVFVERGPFWHVLERVIQERDIDLIVAGTHGRRGLKKLVMGSVAEEIFRRARCPVMTIGPHISTDGIAKGRIGLILYAGHSETEIAEGENCALSYATGLARESEANLVLLHVLPRTEDDFLARRESMAKDVRQQLLNRANLISRGARLAYPPLPIVTFGTPAVEILRVAQQQRAELIVMAVHYKGIGLAAHLPWTTTHRVICEAPCPVLTVRD